MSAELYHQSIRPSLFFHLTFWLVRLWVDQRAPKRKVAFSFEMEVYHKWRYFVGKIHPAEKRYWAPLIYFFFLVWVQFYHIIDSEEFRQIICHPFYLVPSVLKHLHISIGSRRHHFHWQGQCLLPVLHLLFTGKWAFRVCQILIFQSKVLLLFTLLFLIYLFCHNTLLLIGSYGGESQFLFVWGINRLLGFGSFGENSEVGGCPVHLF